MKLVSSSLFAAMLLAAPMVSHAQAVSEAKTDSPVYTVFVDAPTGYTFVKLPDGWKFVGAVTQEDARLVQAGSVPKAHSSAKQSS
ncbi:hypothetical protein K788_0004209 (plasmid) [Paraburkholderia caribensis MBA4]|uniref:Uncharacterized protein n=1 Tax=Paraburkholderia caribensis MBA4 TaxID=1323664 RepID=A0A0P0RPD4_9BURK|nr:hypothetical protein [Paraburkholderia caribensis]ALL70826.1 hypothetical protein K788_0004209 [Paraburkholderia caribensis MBA4]